MSYMHLKPKGFDFHFFIKNLFWDVQKWCSKQTAIQSEICPFLLNSKHANFRFKSFSESKESEFFTNQCETKSKQNFGLKQKTGEIPLWSISKQNTSYFQKKVYQIFCWQNIEKMKLRFE